MALSPAMAKAHARAELDSVFGPIPPDLQASEKSAMEEARDQLAQAIASQSSYIQQNATVMATVASVSGVVPGGGMSGPGTATGTLF